MALVDAIHDQQILELLQTHADEHQSLYRSEQDPKIAPHLVRFVPRSTLLKQLIQRGWGRQWGLYLTSALSLQDLRPLITRPCGSEAEAPQVDAGPDGIDDAGEVEEGLLAAAQLVQSAS